MERIVRRTTIWILPRRCSSARRASAGSTARSLSATTRSSRPDITARRAGGKTAPTSATACANRCVCRAGSGMNSAAASMPRQTPLSPLPATSASEGTFISSATTRRQGRSCPDATSCSMCRRMIINAGLRRVVIRNTETEFTVVSVQDWIDQDDTLEP